MINHVGKTKILSLIFIYLGLSSSLNLCAQQSPAPAIDFNKLAQDLAGPGLEGYVHGADANSGIYVFTWRDPDNFFQFANFSMVAKDSKILNVFRTLERHDKVLINGEFIDNGAPQKHIAINAIKLLQKRGEEFADPVATSFPAELYSKSEITALVHIVDAGGAILVIDYKNDVIPVFVSKPELTQNLYRNDKIKFKFKIQSYPKSPQHLELDVDAQDPLTVIDSIASQNGKVTTLEGSLVRFPKSEEIKFDIYALQIEDAQGIKINYTLANFDDMDVFAAIRKKLGDLWDAHKDAAVNGRNKWVNPALKVKIAGTINVVDPGQANPQLLLAGPDAIEAYLQVCDWQKL